MFLLGRIRNAIEKGTITEERIIPEARLAICLYRFARGDYYFTKAEMSGIEERTVGYIVNAVTTAIVECLWEDTIKKHMPKSEEEFRSKILDMEEAQQFPCCWSAVDLCHIPIKCPPGRLKSCKEYHNFKNFSFLVVLMCMVDSKNRFVWPAAAISAIRMTQSLFSVLVYGIKSRNRNISPKLARKWVPFFYLRP